jgi:hypothetical protein
MQCLSLDVAQALTLLSVGHATWSINPLIEFASFAILATQRLHNPTCDRSLLRTRASLTALLLLCTPPCSSVGVLQRNVVDQHSETPPPLAKAQPPPPTLAP